MSSPTIDRIRSIAEQAEPGSDLRFLLDQLASMARCSQRGAPEYFVEHTKAIIAACKRQRCGRCQGRGWGIAWMFGICEFCNGKGWLA